MSASHANARVVAVILDVVSSCRWGLMIWRICQGALWVGNAYVNLDFQLWKYDRKCTERQIDRLRLEVKG